MKETVIRFRVSESEKKTIEMLAEASAYTKGLSEYILDLIREDAKCYHEICVDGVVYGPNKDKSKVIEKRRISIGPIFVDKDGRGSSKQYVRLIKEASDSIGNTAKQSGHYMVLEVNGKRVDPPAPMADYVRFE